ncbi:Membrane protein involved in the export of O-antigen and teichoic acid [Ruminococcus sp. YE71]|uniref:lipopolysaccharide biosynthesis protein n=1 Tax=unclassified Ruminococcus TaxID=2608920 RepID=UPI0008906AB3|nr:MULTISPECIES: oligosaccharide flippase family protein [unclassified Ruminococcus]SDA11319.1 Membrane protein involved in the export of O-antigen and teichoic acid [Ruminococcus sp. YE78]SFW15070.1 Membrane protein involved in the export of O-antigen and teichoic acid [Ruminococcus sp. YE71]
MKNRSVGISLQYVNTILNMICGLFLSAYLLRSLGQTEYGLYQTISSFVNYLVLLEFGTGTVITRNIAACRARNDHDGIQKNVSTIWCITCILSGLILLVGIIIEFFLDEIYAKTLSFEQIQYGKQIYLIMLIYLLFSFFSNSFNGVLLGYEKYKIQPIISLIRVIVRTLLLISVIIFVRKSIMIAIIDLILTIIMDVFLVFYCHKETNVRFNFKYFDKSIFYKSMPLATAIFIQALVNQANNNVDKFVIGIKIGPDDVAVYSVGLYVYGIFSSMTSIPISLYGPQVVKEINKGKTPNDVSSELIQGARIIVLIGGTILFGFFAVGKQFISIVYGDTYLLAWKIALIIMVPMLINMSNGIMINILDATDKRIARSGFLLITTIANIFLTVLWISKYGIVGACVATAVCTFIGQIVLMDIYYFRVLKIEVLSFKLKSFKGIFVCQIIASIFAYLVGKIITNAFLSFFAGGLMYIVFFSFLFYFFGTNELEKKAIMKVKSRIKQLYKK